MKFKDITITIQDRIQEREMNGKKEMRKKFHFDYEESDIIVKSPDLERGTNRAPERKHSLEPWQQLGFTM